MSISSIMQNSNLLLLFSNNSNLFKLMIVLFIERKNIGTTGRVKQSWAIHFLIHFLIGKF
ncbi:CLUMA_CG009190, isoform A [Clunio marinus]|uniref:CLUMA_CG009190, isoform A n=1 Tax=Clunio marinus TaxID=568069 RepID=A0A1J1I610_9DIPT|nr:CLUMA_CG009190, isoform A [Clunio marinus]